MYMGNLVFSQVMEHLPLHTFRRCVQRYRGNHKIQSFSCLDQFRCMAFAPLTYRESLRDIEACLRAQQNKLCHPCKIQSSMSSSIFPSRGQRSGAQVRSDCSVERILCSPGLSRKAPPYQIPRPENRQDICIPDQQFYATGNDDRRSVSLPLAGRTIFQMDQTAPAREGYTRPR